ncbi:Triacylglycerol lipase [Mycobacterium attenuatum]|uniref:Triacylglycerol lipase n=1 Tax=Mycobacterium attenuatum TaxID=2341086 RepID=A0A498PWR8_9MYCO|nr:Triacylglycerol lipase [Mycobacterium attenuatum]
MSYVITQPETLVVAASELAGVGSAINTATAAAAGPTTSLLAAAADEVSAAVVKLFGGYSQEFQGLVAQAAAFHDELTRALSAAASAYVDAEVANMAAAFAGFNVFNAAAQVPASMAPPNPANPALVMGAPETPCRRRHISMPSTRYSSSPIILAPCRSSFPRPKKATH